MRKTGDEIRDELLDRAARYLLTEPPPSPSLQAYARALGTSSRMLVHYFGTQGALAAEAVVRARALALEGSRAALDAPGRSVALVDALWAFFCGETGRGALARLGQRGEGRRGLVIELVFEEGTDELARRLVEEGMPRRAARPFASLAMAAVVGAACVRAEGENESAATSSIEELKRWVRSEVSTARR